MNQYKGKKILILGASRMQLPAIVIAKKHGAEVAVVDYDDNAIGREYADKFYNFSSTDLDAIEKVYLEFKPNSVFTMATDAPVKVIGFLSDKYNLSYLSYEDSLAATNKHLMIERFKLDSIPHPMFTTFDLKLDVLANLINSVKSIGYPCIIKPIDSSGSRGVYTAKTEYELVDLLNKSLSYSKSQKVIIEELMIGKEVSVEMLVINEKSYVIGITDKKTTGYPHFVEISHSEPTNLSSHEKEMVSSLAKRAVESIKIINGSAHVEIMVTKNGPKIIELGARLGGDYITSHLVPYSTNFDIVKASIDISLHLDPEIDLDQFSSIPTMIQFFTPFTGKIDKLPDLTFLLDDELIHIEYLKRVGEIIDETPNSANRLGFYIIKSESVIRLFNKADKVNKKIERLFRLNRREEFDD